MSDFTERGLDKVQGVVEVEEAVVEGLDISGYWSRMLVERSIDEYPTEGLDWISALEGGESLRSCYQCAKCVPVCPVQQVGDYGPWKIFRKVQHGSNLLDDPDLWLCTTCANCLRVCPKQVDMMQIMPAVREQAVLEGKMPNELAEAFANLQRRGNPQGESPRKRDKWAKEAEVEVPLISELDRPVDVLLYVSDYTSYHPRGNDAARAMSRVLNTLGVDWAILGKEEKSDGDSARVAGERGLFEMLAEDNIATFAKYEFKQLVVMDPHAYNAFKNHYPALGGKYDVLHYTQFLAPLIDRMEFQGSVDMKVTFHDPCYLGRHNGEFDAPRKLLQAIPGVELIEMPHYKKNGYCCGGGGGGMWIDSVVDQHVTERLSERRVREAAGTGAATLAVCCPYEPSRFEDAVKSTGHEGQLDVSDIIELLDKAMHPATES